MKKLLLIVLFCAFNILGFSQFDTEKIIRITSNDSLMFEDDSIFQVSEIPDKWKNESAVIIAIESYTERKIRKTYPYYFYGYRERVKLLDNAAILDYSELELVNVSGFLLKVIKPDGSVKKYNYSELKPSIAPSEGEYPLTKLAIPNLEPNDIIDFCYYQEFPYEGNRKNYFFLVHEYPIMHQKLVFTMGALFYPSFNSYNGAPKMMLEEDSKKRKVYVLFDKERDKHTDLYFDNIYSNTPMVKFNSTYYDDYRLPSSKLSQQDAYDYFNFRFNRKYDELSGINILNSAQRYFFNKYKTDFNPYTLLDECYYFFRYKFFFEDYNKSGKYTYIWQLSDGKVAYDFDFLELMRKIGTTQNSKNKNNLLSINSIVAIQRLYGGFDDALFYKELLYGLEFKYKDSIKYYFPFSRHSTADCIPYIIEGSDAYRIKYAEDKSAPEIEQIKLPISKYNDNQINSELFLEINSDNTLLIKRNVKVKGHFKEDYENLIIEPELDKIEGETYGMYKEPYAHTKNELNEKKRKIKASIDEFKKKRIDFMKFLIEEDFQMVSYDTLEILKDGRFKNPDALEFRDVFAIKDIIKTVGSNILFEVGKLIGPQIQLKESEYQRTYDVFFDYPNSYNYTFVLNIPNGYTPEGLDQLNLNVDNETSSFISKGKIEDNKLVVEVSCILKNNYESKEKWPQIVKTIEAAFDFSQKTVLLKKIQ
ncbi:MAG TPA: hypothetical protein DEA97_18170 [Bacteroidales bacterium]|nr:MAG: hypothetical protein UR43_C0009G0011 [candidate division TM6 bacterium GW2011_GWF2_33_332]OFY79207.1 MAG: hypothetical protein A2281_14685 [Bacteroidetes bacterium RIFOXYA12_FULL_38_20]HBS88491.1 hypothetical protein [Bacteroidales bacterium]